MIKKETKILCDICLADITKKAMVSVRVATLITLSEGGKLSQYDEIVECHFCDKYCCGDYFGKNNLVEFKGEPK